MLQNKFKSVLEGLTAKTDISHRGYEDMFFRFKSLRGSHMLPIGKRKHLKHLNAEHVVSGICALSAAKPSYAAVAARTLMNLRPVGGVKNFFFEAETLNQALQCCISDEKACDSVVEVKLCVSELYMNSNGRASITYLEDGVEKTSYYVSQHATSLLSSGAEKTYDPRNILNSAASELVIYGPFFQKVRREFLIEWPSQKDLDLQEGELDDDEKKEQERKKRLNITPSSRYLNLGVDCQVTWPNEETLVEFEGYQFVLMPKTKENTTSMHIDLVGQRINYEDATTLFNRFLSIMAFCDDQFAVLQEGWSGNPVPVAVPKRNLGFSTAHDWVFNRRVPDNDKTRLALALYRDGRNAQQNYMIPYAVLSYYKVIELQHPKKCQDWMEETFLRLKENLNLSENVSQFMNICIDETPGQYLYKACRCAVAHAEKPSRSSDPDDGKELKRLYESADIMRALARIVIHEELGVSDSMFDGS